MRQRLIQELFARFVRFATAPDDDEQWKLKKVIGMMAATILPLLQFQYCLMYFYFEERPAAIALGSAGLLSCLGLLSYACFPRRYGSYIVYMLFTFTLGIVSAHVLLGGFANSGGVAVWIILYPLLLVVIYRPSSAFWGGIAAIAIVTGCALVQPLLRASNHLPEALVRALYVTNMLGTGAVAALAMFYYVWQNARLLQLVTDEQARAETLLLNILPREIAAILKRENRVIADRFDGASILFADIVNFTPLSATLSPGQLIELLNEVFSHFDALVERYGLEKIKTIGDCYMVAAGVPCPRPDHAQALTRLALDMRSFAQHFQFHGQQLAFRIGLNSGPVAAGVIGRKKFIYDLWGDTVNTASRMESHGQAGAIQVSAATHALIAHEFVCEARGVIDIKGKGDMPVWHVLGLSAAP
jgi:adenylate cyclase